MQHTVLEDKFSHNCYMVYLIFGILPYCLNVACIGHFPYLHYVLAYWQSQPASVVYHQHLNVFQ